MIKCSPLKDVTSNDLNHNVSHWLIVTVSCAGLLLGRYLTNLSHKKDYSAVRMAFLIGARLTQRTSESSSSSYPAHDGSSSAGLQVAMQRAERFNSPQKGV